MSDSSDIQRLMNNLTAERNAVFLYRSLADAEGDSSLAGIYRQLADTEQRHADVWASKLREAGAEVPPFSPAWRTRVLRWMARRFGVGLVLPTLAAIEKEAGSEYAGQTETEIPVMVKEERSHARVFNYLARKTGGMEGRSVARLEGRHRSAGGNALRAGVLGANDGLLSNLSLIMGVAGAEMSSGHILITGLAGLLAGAGSMALGEWLSVQSSRELHERQMGIEKEELALNPEEEKEELALIYQAKGASHEEARKLADRLLSDPSTALDTLAREELGLDPEEMGGSAWEAAIVSFLLFAVGASIPLLPFFFLRGASGIIWSATASGVGLFVIGAAITLITGRSAFYSGLRQVLFGAAAAAITFGIGHLVGAHLGG
jgi:VIT1/CCC1 family predicted Fe2+/Mn2+ transporter